MGIADDMKKITESIVTSHDVRVKALDNLVADTRKTLKGFASGRKKMSKEQAKNLADFVEGLSKSGKDMLKGFQKSRKQMSDDQAKRLADFLNNLTNDVGSMLNIFLKKRSEMSKELNNKLVREVRDIETYVKKRLKEFNETHAEMSDALKKSLTKYVLGIASETRKLSGEYRLDMKKASIAWQNMSKTLVTARKGRAVVPEVEEVEVPPEIGMEDLEEMVLEFINSHPGGVKVGDMEYPLGVARTRLGVISKRLLEEGKVRKEENLYFPNLVHAGGR